MPAPVIAQRIGWPHSLTPLKDRLALIRPVFVGVDPADRVVYEPGRDRPVRPVVPRARIPVGGGQARCCRCWRWCWATPGSCRRDDPVAPGRGHPGRDVAAHRRLGTRCPRPWSGTGSPRSAAPGSSPPRRRRSPGRWAPDPAGPAAGPGVQGAGRAPQRLLRDLVPARAQFTSPVDFNAQIADWLTAGERPHRARDRRPPGGPAGRPTAPRWSPLPPVAPPVGLPHRVRLARDYYVRVDGNDYSVDPRAIGRFVDVIATPADGRGPSAPARSSPATPAAGPSTT